MGVAHRETRHPYSTQGSVAGLLEVPVHISKTDHTDVYRNKRPRYNGGKRGLRDWPYDLFDCLWLWLSEQGATTDSQGQAIVDNGRFPLLAGSKIEVGHPEFLLLLL